MSQTNLTADEVIDSLTESDEDAIVHHFGDTWTNLALNNPAKLARAMAFVVKRREGLTDDEARQVARSLTTKGYSEFFAEEPQDAGKDEPLVSELSSSLTSVS